MRMYFLKAALALLNLLPFGAASQPSPEEPWHGQARSVRYTPDGQDFMIVNGTRRFNRALYGTNTAFRIEAGDLPELALYSAGMGGNLQLGIVRGDSSKWLREAKRVETRYRAGSMHYKITDPLLGKATLYITVLPAAQGEALLVDIRYQGKGAAPRLCWAFGGATGKRFSRDGDIGADPESSFYLKPEYCRGHVYTLAAGQFTLPYGNNKTLHGIVPSPCQVGDATQLGSPHTLIASQAAEAPVVYGTVTLSAKPLYFAIENPLANTATPLTYAALPEALTAAEQARATLAGRITLITPDPHLNTVGSALAVAADAIWEDPTYLHGAVAWRMRLNAWRGAYAADQLGWHDRALRHFTSYAASQLTTPPTGPLAPDTALHFARQQEQLGNTLFSSGYICRNPNGDFRAHHYDMNLVFVDQLLTHFEWTGDTAAMRRLWPLLTRHMAWEKRNFDHDDDGLYDAYCCIWASDALQYSGGSVTHSSAYNYRAHTGMARIAKRLGYDPLPYQHEAQKIHNALQRQLWLPQGWYAEYKDLLGHKAVHPAAGLWTIYHAIDSHVPDAFQAYQSLRYVDKAIPHIPIRAQGLPPGDYYTLSTTNWQPYTWSINNVALAEVLHTTLAYWQGGRADEAFRLWKSALLESMYLGASPGNFQQLSFYDAARGELYRDFADPIGVAARTLVEGLFGIHPDALADTVYLHPGFPSTWDHASLKTPDVSISFRRQKQQDVYTVSASLPRMLAWHITLPARRDGIRSVTVNGKKVPWRVVSASIGTPQLAIALPAGAHYTVTIEWQGKTPIAVAPEQVYTSADTLATNVGAATIVGYHDPQQVLGKVLFKDHDLRASIGGSEGHKTVFINVRQGAFTWWMPVHITLRKPLEITQVTSADSSRIAILVHNRTRHPVKGTLTFGGNATPYTTMFDAAAKTMSAPITIPPTAVTTGTNPIMLRWQDQTVEQSITWWHTKHEPNIRYKPVPLTPYFNDQLTCIFQHEYRAPRPPSPTLQLPWQGIGNWCYPLVTPVIDDTGLRHTETTVHNIPFTTSAKADAPNVAFVSLWDQYPDSLVVPLQGRAQHVYLLLAGTTNPMQSRLNNGLVTVQYTDGTQEYLWLRNPETWWPIEQDYLDDGYAFTLGGIRPPRIALATGKPVPVQAAYTAIKGFTTRAIPGGAATVLDLPLQADKTLRCLTVRALANDVIIGLLGVTLAVSATGS